MGAVYSNKPEIDIARNIKTIEWLKSELVSSIANLLRGMMKNSEEVILDALANMVITCYILCRRIGIGFSRLTMKVENKVKANIEAGHEIEQWYKDFSAFRDYMQDIKRCS